MINEVENKVEQTTVVGLEELKIAEEKKNVFETKIAPVLTYVGTIGAILMSIAYIVAVFVLIFGFKARAVLTITVFSFVNAAVGFCIMQFLKIQGISFAKEIPENKKLLKEYYTKQTKDKVFRSIKHFWITSIIKDLFVKCLTIAISTAGVIYLVFTGSKDFALIGLAVINLIMFICFGIVSLVKAYEAFNNEHIPYIRQQLKQEPDKQEKEKKVCLTSETKNSATCKSKSKKTKKTSQNSKKVSKSHSVSQQ